MDCTSVSIPGVVHPAAVQWSFIEATTVEHINTSSIKDVSGLTAG